MTAEMTSRVDFDHHSPELSNDPYPVYAELRRQCPVSHSTAWGGFWAVTGLEEVTAVALDDDTFCSGQGVALPAIGQARPLLPIECDAPEFYTYRRLLNPRLSPVAAKAMEERIKATCAELVDAFIESGQADFVQQLAMPLPARTTLRLLGIDDARWEWFLERIHIGVHESAQDLDRSVEAMFEVYAAIAEAYEARMADGLTGEDLISYLGRAVRDEVITEDHLLDMCLLTLFGGLDTTAAVIGNALYHLAGMPEERATLRDDPARLDVALEEFLRFEAPVQGLARTVTKDVVLGGQQLEAGDKVWMLWASANRDPNEFPDPDVLKLDREPNRHMSFGIGIHRCLGSNVARVMFRAAVSEVLQRIPDYALQDGYTPQRFPDSSVVYALTSLPVTFPPGSPSASTPPNGTATTATLPLSAGAS